MSDITQYFSWTLIFPLATLMFMFLFITYYWQVQAPKKHSLEWIAMQERKPMTFQLGRHPMERQDALPLILLTAIYAITAFFQLGSLTNPQTHLSFYQEDTAQVAWDEPITVSRIGLYTGIGTGEYTIEVSLDGTVWSTLEEHQVENQSDNLYAWSNTEWESDDPSFRQLYTELLAWHFIQPLGDGYTFQYMRITGDPDDVPLQLGELAFYDPAGNLIPGPTQVIQAGSTGDLSLNPLALFDEQDVVPESSTWFNSAYFDEIYHPRTAYEHLEDIEPYEISHPPLGKLILSIGIQLFGMTPFGWRFMGTLCGVLMLPFLYIFLKNMFGKTVIALCGTALFAFDFMHLVQTRIGTIDSYAVFFILVAYFFMYRYLTLPSDSRFRTGALPLFLSGLFWGIGIASKWTVIYAGAGLAVLFFIGVFFRWKERQPGALFGRWLAKTLVFSVFAWVFLPLFIYTLSYWPYAVAYGSESGLFVMLGQIFTWPFQQLPLILSGERELFVAKSPNIVDAMLENQHFMFTYHVGVDTPHPYSSRWYQWIVDGRPILYYLDNSSVEGYKTAFASFNNPVVAWGGLLAMISVAVQAVRQRCGKALFILVGFLSQFLPWLFISRITFAYHYFPSTLFLVLAMAYLMNTMVERKIGHWKWGVYGMTGFAVGLYVLFYPVLIGISVPTWFASNFLAWIPGGAWPF